MTAKARLPPPTSHQKKKLSPLSTYGQVRCGILCSPLSHGGPGSGCQGQGWSGLASTVSFFLPSLRTKLWNLELSLHLNVPSNQQIPPRSRQLQVKDFGEEEEEKVAREGMKPLTSEGESLHLPSCGLSHKREKERSKHKTVESRVCQDFPVIDSNGAQFPWIVLSDLWSCSPG